MLGEGALREAEETRKWFDDRAFERRQRPIMDGLIDGGQGKVEEHTGTTNDLGSEELRIAIKVSSRPYIHGAFFEHRPDRVTSRSSTSL